MKTWGRRFVDEVRWSILRCATETSEMADIDEKLMVTMLRGSMDGTYISTIQHLNLIFNRRR